MSTNDQAIERRTGRRWRSGRWEYLLGFLVVSIGIVEDVVIQSTFVGIIVVVAAAATVIFIAGVILFVFGCFPLCLFFEHFWSRYYLIPARALEMEWEKKRKRNCELYAIWLNPLIAKAQTKFLRFILRQQTHRAKRNRVVFAVGFHLFTQQNLFVCLFYFCTVTPSHARNLWCVDHEMVMMIWQRTMANGRGLLLQVIVGGR